MNILTILLWIKNNWKKVIKGIFAAAVAFLLLWGINNHNENKRLSQELEMTQNNIEAYLELLDSSLLANNVLRLDFEDLQQLHDTALKRIDNMRKTLGIKSKSVSVAATQSLTLNVKESKGVGGDIKITPKDSILLDSIIFNLYTTAHYTITPDTVTIALDILNDLYLYIYTVREYKNKKNFFKRLFTWDFKKVDKREYILYNTNDLIKSNNLRIVESTKK